MNKTFIFSVATRCGSIKKYLTIGFIFWTHLVYMQLCAWECIWLRKWALEWRFKCFPSPCLRSVACACVSTATKKGATTIACNNYSAMCNYPLPTSSLQQTLFLQHFITAVGCLFAFVACTCVYHNSFQRTRCHWGWQQFPTALGA